MDNGELLKSSKAERDAELTELLQEGPSLEAVEVLDLVTKKIKRAWYRNRSLEATKAAKDAFQKIKKVIRDTTIARDILSVLRHEVGTLEHGPRPFVAGDPLLFFRGEQIGREDGVYLLCAVNKDSGELCFPGGFCDSMMSAFLTLYKEASQEVLGDVHDPEKLLSLKWAVGESSDPTRSVARYKKLGLQVVSYMGLMIPKKEAKLQFKSGDDASGFKFVKVFNADGSPNYQEVKNDKWRDDHHALVTKLLDWWVLLKAKNGLKNTFIEFLEDLPDQEIVKTPFAPTPESNPPRTYNVSLAETLVQEMLWKHKKNIRLASKMVKELVGKYIPFFDGPRAAVDVVVIGRGNHADHILLSKGEDGKWRLPGRILRQGENIKKAAEVAVYEKHSKHATPRMFAGIVQEWLPDGVTLRDDREPTVGFLYVSEMSGGGSEKMEENEQWFPLFNPERTGISEELLGLEFAFHHDVELKLVVGNLLKLGVVQPGDQADLLAQVTSRAVSF